MGLFLKYLLVLLVVAIGVWSVLARLRGPKRDDGQGRSPVSPTHKPVEMVRCAHCGLHLAASDAVAGADKLYCSQAHQRLGPSNDASA